MKMDVLRVSDESNRSQAFHGRSRSFKVSEYPRTPNSFCAGAKQLVDLQAPRIHFRPGLAYLKWAGDPCLRFWPSQCSRHASTTLLRSRKCCGLLP